MDVRNYWLILCNPDEWFGSKVRENANVNDMLFNIEEENWRVRESHFKDVKIGDLGIIKVGEDGRSKERRTLSDDRIVEKLNAGIYAIFEVVKDKNNRVSYFENDTFRINFKVINNLFKQNNIIDKLHSKELLKGYYNQQSSVKMEKNIFENVIKFINKEFKMSEFQPLNQILFGPPGTGKTYNTINKAIEIIENRILTNEELEPKNRTALKEKFEGYKKAGQIEFVTFHQSYGYEEFVEGIKAKTENENLIYETENGIFKKLSEIANKNIEQSKDNVIIKKSFEQIFKEKILDKMTEDEKLEVKMKKSSFFIKEVDDKHINFDKSSGDSQHVLLIKNLKTMYDIGENKIIMGGLSQYYNPLLEYLLENSQINNATKEPLKNYILIIDEINRGNISKIFGELITLIEPSKRIGADEEIKVKLPYSNDEFGVPQNLYILGTMNTADRSIALMDTALRRRFEFIEMLPDLEVLKGIKVEEIEIYKLLETINKRVEYLYDRDHTIGHAYFMSLKENATLEELENIFRNKIIPLLQEYFYDDWEKILMILGLGFIEKEIIKDDIFDYQVDDYLEDEKCVYKIKDKFDFSKFQK